VAEGRTIAELERDELRVRVGVLEGELKKAHRENDWLRSKLARYLRQLFGRKAEKVDPEQLQLPFEDLMEVAEAQAEPPTPEHAREAADDEEGTRAPKPKRKGAHGRAPLPEELPRVQVRHEPSAEDCTCPSCKQPMSAIGEEVTEELDYEPASLKVIEHVRPKYACRRCAQGVVIADLPPRPIEKGRPGAGLLAHVLTAKYCDHLPLYRMEGIFQRHGVALSRSTLCDWVGAAAELLEPIAKAIRESVLDSRVIHSDDTPVLCLEPGGRRRSYLWVYVGDRKEVAYDFTLDRSRDGPERFLAGWEGSLQADGYSGFEGLYRSDKVLEIGCWAHARRKYFDAIPSDTSRASHMVALIQQLYGVEAEARQRELDPEDVGTLRQERCGPILERIRATLEEHQRSVLPRSAMGEATTYLNNQWPALVRYVEDGRRAIDNNAAERAMRCVAVGRKNWLFAGSPAGGRRAAVIYTVIGTCKLQGVEPFAYLRDVLQRVSTHPASRLAELMPRGWRDALLAN
jgi:transposase